MAYKGWVRHVFQRVKVEGQKVRLAAPVSIQEALEDATASVAEFRMAEKAGVNYGRNKSVTIDHIRQDPGGDGNVRRRPLFKGRINVVRAASYPNEVTVTATGRLADLRLSNDKDINLTGKTDKQAAELILDTCLISKVAGKIKGSSYVLGQREPVIWAAGTTGASMMEELNRVFGYAMVEVNGEINRIKYSRVPSDYPGSIPNAREFFRGQEGVTFYGNERTRGNIEEVVNRWEISGLEYEIGDTATDGDGDGIAQEGKEGCKRRIWASCQDDNHKLLGKKVYITGTFSSDLIQDAGLAKAICKRMMEWHNREVDTERITCANTNKVTPGDLVAVKDKAFGIDLKDKEKYVVMAVNRQGDTMTLDCLGGKAGKSDKVKGGIEECCGSWEEDGTCTPNEKDDIVEPPPLPPLPEIPEDPVDDWCNPSTDPTCLPDSSDRGPDIGGDGLPVGDDGGAIEPGAPTTPPVVDTTSPDICVFDDALPGGVVGNGALCCPTGNVPAGQITGGMPWSNICQWFALVETASDLHKAPAQFLASMLIVESGGVSGVGGVGGAVGLMQIKPEIWQTEATQFGYDLATDAGQIGMAAVIIGGKSASTTGMDPETAFLTVYYPVFDGNGNLCLSCYGESGHTPQMYLNDIATFTAAMNAACGVSVPSANMTNFEGAMRARPEFCVSQGPGGTFSHSVCDCYDFALVSGTPIYSPLAGTVTAAFSTVEPTYGKYVQVQTNSGVLRFAHLSSVLVAVGQSVTTATKLGLSGDSGSPGAFHVHVQLDGTPVADTNTTGLTAILDRIGMVDRGLVDCAMGAEGRMDGPPMPIAQTTPGRFAANVPSLCFVPGWNIVNYYVQQSPESNHWACLWDTYFTASDSAWAYVDANGRVQRVGVVKAGGNEDPRGYYDGQRASIVLTSIPTSQWAASTLDTISRKVSQFPICAQGFSRFNMPGSIDIRFNAYVPDPVTGLPVGAGYGNSMSLVLYSEEGGPFWSYRNNPASDLAIGWFADNHGSQSIYLYYNDPLKIGRGSEVAPVGEDFEWEVCFNDDERMTGSVWTSYGVNRTFEYNDRLWGYGLRPNRPTAAFWTLGITFGADCFAANPACASYQWNDQPPGTVGVEVWDIGVAGVAGRPGCGPNPNYAPPEPGAGIDDDDLG